MTYSDHKNKEINFSNDIDDEIKFSKLTNIILRNKYLIFLLTTISTTASIFYCLLSTKIYQGSFQIVVEESKENSTREFPGFISPSSTRNKTQEFILKSPSVLKPVYNYAINEYKKRGDSIDNLSYFSWINKSLKIRFERGTNVLSIDFIDKDRDFIINTLNLISNKYKDYSKSERETTLNKKIKFLSSQSKMLKAKSEKSLNEFNVFTVKNGLGYAESYLRPDPQGINKLNISDKNYKDNRNFGISNNIRRNPIIKNTGNLTGDRFQKQFLLFEKYEAEYLDYSSKLKPNAKLLSELKIKIDNIKKSLKRPSEILIKHRQLLSDAQTDEDLFKKIEQELILSKIDLAEQKDPWDLISEPTINDGKYFPNSKEIVSLTFLISILIGISVSYFKEKKLGIIYELDSLKKIITCKYLETIFSNNILLSNKLFLKTIEKNLKKESKISSIGIIDFHSSDNLNFLKDPLIIYDNQIPINFFNIEEQTSIDSTIKLIFMIPQDKITNKDIFLINNYSKIHAENVIGWIYVDSKFIF